MSSLSACHSARSKSEIRGVKTPLICLSFLRELKRVIIAINCLINDRGIYPTFSGFALASSYVIFSVRSLFKSYFLGVRSEFNTHNPAICQAYFLPLPYQNLSISCFLFSKRLTFFQITRTLYRTLFWNARIRQKS